MAERRYLVIGGGIAGVSAAEAIREQDPSGRIVLLSAERELPYARPLLSKAPLLSPEMKKLALHPQKWYTDRDIELRLGVAARHLDTQRRTVDCGGETLPYDRCVLALGANNFIPPFQGREEVPLCGLRTLDDLRRLQRLALGKERAVVIGGGVIGLELAAELVRYGLEVSVLEAMPSLMPRLIGPDISRWLQEQLPRLHIHTGVSITRLYRSGEEMVVEADGGQWTCQVLAAACGVRANTALAAEAGIDCQRAIVVNERMETSAAGVYACGDCAQFQGFNAALWNQGLRQGAAAGNSAAGGQAVYTGCDTSLVLNLDGTALFAMGNLSPADGRTEWEDWPARTPFQVDPRRPAVPGRCVRVWQGDRLVGAALLGDLTGMQALKAELREQGGFVC
ncbi:MAG: NAD(P)/FAD-dependent oxidoreductase [Oscillospiraceae bacterium]|nr:NAD(P)/FAD-dependent oxidoreductase [Oscillospiraceae bacterium]